MKVTKKSMISGTYRTADIDVTREQIEAWMEGTLIQEAMPNLTPAEREFIKTGTTPREWIELMGCDPGDVDDRITILSAGLRPTDTTGIRL